MFFHHLFQSHIADPQRNRWDNGLFVSSCQICQRAMVKPPGAAWKLQIRSRAA